MSDKEDLMEFPVGVVFIELVLIKENEERWSWKICDVEPPQSEDTYFT